MVRPILHQECSSSIGGRIFSGVHEKLSEHRGTHRLAALRNGVSQYETEGSYKKRRNIPKAVAEAVNRVYGPISFRMGPDEPGGRRYAIQWRCVGGVGNIAMAALL
ncbi:hypothetical protein MTO96_016777 [Rhipicephalus appendiculatus]